MFARASLRFGFAAALVAMAAVIVSAQQTAQTVPPVSPQTAAQNAIKASRPEGFGKGAYEFTTPHLIQPRITRQAAPNYTEQAMRQKLEGDVVMEVVIGAEGSIVESRIIRSLDTVFGLDAEAQKVIKKWQFTPATLDGKAVPVFQIVELAFRLH